MGSTRVFVFLSDRFAGGGEGGEAGGCRFREGRRVRPTRDVRVGGGFALTSIVSPALSEDCRSSASSEKDLADTPLATWLGRSSSAMTLWP